MKSKRPPKKRSLIERVKEAGAVALAVGAIVTLGGGGVGILWYFKPEWRPWQSQQIGLEGKVISETTSLEQYLKHIGIEPVVAEPVTRSPANANASSGLTTSTNTRNPTNMNANASMHGKPARSFSRAYLRSTGRMFTAVIRITGRARANYFLNWRMKNTANGEMVYDSKSDFVSELNQDFSRDIKLDPSVDQVAARIWVPATNANRTDLAGEFEVIVDVFDVEGNLIYTFQSERFKLP